MKNQILMLAVFLFSSVVSFAQTTPELKCGTMEYLQKQKDTDSTLESRMLLQEQQIQQWIKQNSGHNSRSVITVPVVVHIVYKDDTQNVSDQRVIEQINMSNRDNAGNNTHPMGAFSTALKANTGMQFCLAQKAPNGTSTNGIERRKTTHTSFPATGDSVKFYSKGGLDAWDPTKYLNVWICNASGYGGYAKFPTTGVNETYGAVVHFYYFGATGANPNADNGGVTTHEIGHCFNLYHVWGDDNGACTGTDYCADVPNQANSTPFGFYSGVITDACSPTSPGIMYMNFMDYSYDSAWANFTPNQTSRIQALFASPSGLLLSLANSDAGSAPTSCETPTSLKATSITKNSAVFGWTAMYGASGYNIRYRKQATTTWISTTSSTNSKSISGLKTNVTYELQVQTICSSGTSNYCSSKVFKTTNSRDSETGIDALITSLEFNLFPNPAKGQVTLSYYLKNAENAEIRLIDITGRIIKSEKITANQGQNNYTLDLNMVTKGLYFVELRIVGQTSIVKKLSVE